jgi:hypothetical protein
MLLNLALLKVATSTPHNLWFHAYTQQHHTKIMCAFKLSYPDNGDSYFLSLTISKYKLHMYTMVYVVLLLLLHFHSKWPSLISSMKRSIYLVCSF